MSTDVKENPTTERKRKLASVVEIDTISPIEGADKIEVCTMKGKGWKVVVGKNEFKPGDKAVYFEIDSFINAEDERFKFLHERCLRKIVSKSGLLLYQGCRIKTAKLRGMVSQGLIMPLKTFLGKEIESAEIAQNEDLTEVLKVEHYDEVVERFAPMTGGNPIAADAMGKFPSDFIPKTDEERCQNLADWWDKYKGMTWEVTAKDDGSSVTMFYSPTVDAENPFGVCTRNLRLKPLTANGNVPVTWQVAKKYDIERKLKEFYNKTGKEYALQGELLGPGVNSDRDKYTEYEWHVFKVYDVKEQKFLFPAERRKFCSDYGIDHVQLISEAVDIFTKYPTCDDLLKYAEGKTARGNEREGLVFKSNTVPSMSFKAVSNRYLLKMG